MNKTVELIKDEMEILIAALVSRQLEIKYALNAAVENNHSDDYVIRWTTNLQETIDLKEKLVKILLEV